MNNKKKRVLITLVMVVLVLGGATAWFFFVFAATTPDVANDIEQHFAETVGEGNEENVSPRMSVSSVQVESIESEKKMGSDRRVSKKARNRSKPKVETPYTKPVSVIDGIEPIASNTFLLESSLLDDAKSNIAKYIGNAKAVVVNQSGTQAGFKLKGISTGSHLHALGLRNGDMLVAVNGHSLNSTQSASRAVAAVIQATQFRLDLYRRGRPVSIYYRLK